MPDLYVSVILEAGPEAEAAAGPIDTQASPHGKLGVELLGGGLARVLRPPALVPALAVDDVIGVRAVGDAVWGTDVVEAGGHSTLRLIGRHGHPVALADAVVTRHGCRTFGTALDGLSTVDVPPDVEYTSLDRELRQSHGQAWKDEEACLSAKHAADIARG